MFAFVSFFSAYLIIKTQVCLHYGRLLASDEFLQKNPRGFQDALTDPSGDILFFLVHGGLIFFIIYIFFFFSFWVGIFSIVFYWFSILILKKFLTPFDHPTWAIDLHFSLIRREADYKKIGDELRHQAAKELREAFEAKILNNIKN
jgi:hypothetical protein